MNVIVATIFIFIFVTSYLDQEPGWPISSHAYFGAPRSEEVAPLAQKLPANAPVETLMAGESIGPRDPRPQDPLPTYVSAREHFGTIRSADLTPASKPGGPIGQFSASP
jgi:hypothetical protein